MKRPLAPHTVTPDGGSVASEEDGYRKDYPIDTAAESTVNRRQMLGFLAGASALLTCGQFALLARGAKRSTAPTEANPTPGEPKLIVAATEIPPVGEALLFRYPGPHDPCLLVHLPEVGLVAYSQRCTHLACPVVPRVEENELHCPCHNGAFDIATGAPKYGPPKKPLPRVALEQWDDGLYATGMIYDGDQT